MTRGRGGYRGGGNRGAQPGGAPSGQNNGQNRGRGRGGARFKNSRDAEIEMEVQAITAQLNFSHMNGPQPYRGRGRGGSYTPNRGGYYSPRGGRGSGARTPNFNDYQYTHHAKAQQARRGSGLGYQGNAGTPHSYQSYTPKGPKVTMLDLVNRPLHQPIKFVKAGTLFQDEEEIFKPTMAETEQDDAPTASQVEDMFIQNDDAPSASNKSLPQFDAFTMNDMFADSAAEEIPTLSWGFTSEQLNGSIAPTNAVPAVVAPLTATTTTQPTAHVTRVVTESVQTQVSIISSGATGSSAASIPSSTPIPPNNGTQLDINDLFRAAAVGSGASPSVRHPAAHTMPIAPLSAHINTPSNPEQRADEELFVIDTDGNAQQSTTITTTEVSTSADQLFFIDTAGGVPNMDQEALHPQEESVSLDFYIDTEPSTSAPQKIRYRVTRLDAQSRALGDHTSDSSSSDEMIDDDDDGDDEVVYRPPNRNVKIQPDISFASLNISSAPLAKDGGPKALSKLAHDGHAKKLKKRAKQKRRKERQRAEVKAELAGKRDAEFYPDVTPIAGPSGSGPAPRVGDSDLEWGSDGPPQSSAPPEVPLTDAKRGTAQKNNNKGKGKAKAQSSAPRGFPASGPGALAAALFASTADDPDHGMDIDPDLALEDEQYEQMLARMLEPEASTFVTIDDVEDEARLRAEDEDMGIAERGSSGDDEDVVFEIAEAIELGMEDDLSDDDDEEEDDDLESSEEEDEEVSFSTKLGRIRAAAQAQGGSRKKSDKPSLGRDPAWDSDDDEEDDDGEDDYDALFGGSKSWNDKDEADIQDMQELYESVMGAGDRKERNALFRAIQNGDFDDPILARNVNVAAGLGKKKKKEGAYVPDDLKAAWQRDREKKAAYKKARTEQRALAALDPLPPPKSKKKRSTGKGKERATAEPLEEDDDLDDDEDGVAPGTAPLGSEDELATMQFTKKASPIVDIPTLIEGIDIFLADIGRQTMALPPMDAASRKKVHEIAHAYSLKSKSVGKGGDRRTTLIRTSLSGLNVSQGKIRALLKRFGAYKHGTEFAQAWDRRAGKDEGKKMIRHRDGDVVGHKAAKIDESNMGFKMLQRMGWKDGERIGVTPGGLAQPLMAVMKNSKLGLGAVKTSQFQ